MSEFSRGKRARGTVTLFGTVVLFLLVFGPVLNRALAAGTSMPSGVLSRTSKTPVTPVCFDCGGGLYYGCAETQHRDDDQYYDPHFKDDAANVHSDCTTSPDTEHLCQEHGWCTFGRELQEQVQQLMKDDNPEPLLALIAEHQANLKVDLAKKELTVIGCERKPIAALRLSRAQVRALESLVLHN